MTDHAEPPKGMIFHGMPFEKNGSMICRVLPQGDVLQITDPFVCMVGDCEDGSDASLNAVGAFIRSHGRIIWFTSNNATRYYYAFARYSTIVQDIERSRKLLEYSDGMLKLIDSKQNANEKIPLAVIHHNNELGYQVWSVVDPSDYENWIESFKDFSDAVDLAKIVGESVRIDCSIMGCGVNHTL